MRSDIKKLCLELNDAFMTYDVDWLNKLIHPDFNRTDRQAQFTYDRETYFENAKHIKERYGVYYFKVIGCDVLSDSSAFYMTYFYGQDALLSQSSERIYCVLTELEDNQFKTEHVLCNPPFEPGYNTLYTNVTIETKLRNKLFEILKIINLQKIDLSPRELDCLFFYLTGNSYQEIADKLDISHKTVDTHLRNSRVKFNLDSLKQLKSLFKLQ